MVYFHFYIILFASWTAHLCLGNPTNGPWQTNTTSEGIATEPMTHMGWKINLVVLGILVLSAGILIIITWKLRYSIKIHSRQPKKVMHFSMTDKLFNFPLPKKLSLALARPSLIPQARKQSAVPRNMGTIQAYSNGQKRDSWDVSRDSVSGGPRCSWTADCDPIFPYPRGMFVSQEPRLSTVRDYSETSFLSEEHSEEQDTQDSCVVDV